ncbi:MAG: hypothetical protein D6820_12540 [Lentisphaerae bacterium]|nr:MAG: hypothetical protein D6820_12540 [Lentisphaerota bacterium]
MAAEDNNFPRNSGRTLEFGTQPIDQIMQQHHLTSKDLVEAGDHITFKQVAKARKGRRLTRKIQLRITAALNACLSEDMRYSVDDLFNYHG